MASDHRMLSYCQACDHTAVARSTSPQPAGRRRWIRYVPVPALADETIRLAFNETPLGPFPAALEAIVAAARRANHYPERDGELIRRLAELHGLTPGMIALGNGADAVIGYLSSAFLRPGDEVITGWPSFPTYLSDAVKQEAVVQLAPLSDGAFDLDAIAELISPRTRLIWVCTPNNPTGGVVTRENFRRFLDAVPERVLVVVDEAYYEFAAGPEQPTRRASTFASGPTSRRCGPSPRSTDSPGCGSDSSPGPRASSRGRQEPPLLRPDRTVRRRGARQPRQSRRGRAPPPHQRAAASRARGSAVRARMALIPVTREFPRRRSRRRRRDRRATAGVRSRDALAQRAGCAGAAAGHGRDRCRVWPPGGSARSRGRAGALIRYSTAPGSPSSRERPAETVNSSAPPLNTLDEPVAGR